MDNRGGGGRTPRGRKPRGRGRGQETPSPRTPLSTTQSPTVSSSSSTPAAAATTAPQTPTTGPSRDDKPKVTQEIKSRPMSTVASPSKEPKSEMSSSSTPKQEFIPKEEPSPAPSLESEVVKVQDIEKKQTISSHPEELPGKDDDDGEEEKKETPFSPTSITSVASSEAEFKTPSKELQSPQILPPTVVESKESTEAEFKTPSKELQPPKLPPPTVVDSSTSTEAKVSEALGKSQPRIQTAKTLVVTPPKDVERSTDAPLSVDIEKAPCATGDPLSPTESSTSQSQRGPSRTGSASPSSFAYALRGPVGKPGYIGGIGFADEEGESPSKSGKHKALARRESAIAAVETAVKRFTKRQWILLFMFGLIDLLSAVTISLQAPFYPAEAEKKGATATEYGFVFGIFEFVVFLTSPIYGKYMNKLGPKTVFSVCIFVTSISTICFGLLDMIDDHTLFITLCFVCRIFEALGCAGFFTATFVIIACEFPESVATTFASLETFFGLGLIVGPTVGGALYDVGGFPLPFFVVGASLLSAAILSSLVMPKIEKVTDEDGEEQAGYGVWTILKIPSVALAAASIASTSMSLGFVSATLEPHIRRFGLTPLQTGLVFIVNGGMYAISAPIWGFICDYINRPVYITILGNIFIFVSFLLIGPAAFMPFDTILWVTIVGLIIQGLGFGCCLVSGFIIGLRDSLAYGLPDNMATYGVASGLWTSMISLGSWVGPTCAGILYDNVGFRDGSYLVLVAALIVGVSNLLYTFCSSVTSKDEESQPLLRPISPLLGKKDVESTETSNLPMSYGTTEVVKS